MHFLMKAVWVSTVCFVLSFTAVTVQASNQLNFQEIQKPLYGRSAANLSFYKNAQGEPGLAYKYNDKKTPGDIFFTYAQQSQWIEPQAAHLLNANATQFRNTALLTPNTSMMLLRGDNNEYSQLLGLSAPPQAPANDTDPIVPGYSNDELRKLLKDNQRLFFSLASASGWSAPQVIRGTEKALDAVLVSNSANTALIAYLIDADDNAATRNDVELYYVFYSNNRWADPVRITNNQRMDHNVQLAVVDGQYLLTWMMDEDGNSNTTNDNRLYYSTISAAGGIATPATTILTKLNNNAIYALGGSTTETILLWSEQQSSGDYTLQEVRYAANSWSNIRSSALSAPNFYNAKIVSLAGRLLLIYQQGNQLQLARHDGTQWVVMKRFDDLVTRAANVAEMTYAVLNNTLWIAYSGHTAVANATQDPDIGDGLYVASYSLAYDLSVSLVDLKPSMLEIGREAVLNIEVANLGFAPSVEYQLEIYIADGRVVRLPGASIGVDAKQQFVHKITIDQVQTRVRLVVVADAQDSPLSNNEYESVITVKPDYFVHKVEKTGAATFAVDIRERKGIAAASPVVKTYLIQNATQTLVSTTQYNPIATTPLTINVDQLSSITGDYQLLVRVNPARTIQEDNYKNNTGVYEHKQITEPDYTITQFLVNDAEISVTLKNLGSLDANPVDLLITDNPDQATQQSATPNPWYFQQVSLDTSGNASLTIPRSALPAINGQTLYAVINPYNTLLESKRNNNALQQLVIPGATGVGVGTVELAIQAQHYLCGNVSFDLLNRGTGVAQNVQASLISKDGLLVASSYLPILAANELQRVTLHNIALGSYELTLQHGSAELAQTSVRLPLELNADGCASTGASNDVQLSALTYAGINASSGLAEFDVKLNYLQYRVDYRKPLLPITLEITVKQGTRLIATRSEKYYIALTAAQEPIKLSLSANEIPPAGGYTLVVKVLDKQDEANTSNNIFTISIQ